MSDGKLTRTIARFQAKIDTGSYYEAHQTLRTITNRYVKSKQYQDAIEILYQGSIILTKNKQYASSSDLISYLIQVYTEANITSQNKDAKLRLIELIGALPDSEQSLMDLSKQSLNWSKIDNEVNKFGDCDLHTLFGNKLLNTVGSSDDNNKLFAVTEFHLILGNHESLAKYVDFLFDWYLANPKVDAGVFLSRAVINYSYLKNIKFVDESITRFITKLKATNAKFEKITEDDLSIDFFADHPLVNFVQLLVLSIHKQDSSNKFLGLYNENKKLLEQYEIITAVEYIGKLYFDLNLGKPKSGNMMANLLGDFFK